MDLKELELFNHVNICYKQAPQPSSKIPSWIRSLGSDALQLILKSLFFH